jgi:transcriptional regulator with XRE-family HTH domain
MATSDTLTTLYGSVGKSIRERRRQLGWTQERLAKTLSMSRASIANIESGRQKLLVHTLLEFATALQVDAADLLPRVTVPETIKNLECFSEPDQNFLTAIIEDSSRDAEEIWLSGEEK